MAQLKLNADWVVLSACYTAAADKPGDFCLDHPDASHRVANPHSVHSVKNPFHPEFPIASKREKLRR
jgi:hypothetical protein